MAIQRQNWPKLRSKKPIVSRVSTKHWKISKLIVGSFLVWGSFSAQAQQNLSLQQAVNKSLAGHPQLNAFNHRRAADEAMVEQAGSATPMTIDLSVEDAMGTGHYSGVSSLQTSLSISWLLEDELLSSKTAVASHQSKLTDLDKATKALNIAAQTAQIFVTLLSQQEQIKLAKLSTRQALNAKQQIAKRVQAGRVSEIDLLRAKADLAKKLLVVEDLTHEIEASKAQLAAQWQGSSEFNAIGDLRLLPELLNLESAIAQLKDNPKLQQFFALQQQLDAEIEQAKVSEQPAWRVSAGVRRNQVVDDFAFVAGLSIPFGAENRNRGKVRALQAQQLEQGSKADAWQQVVGTELLLLTHKLKHNRHVVEGLSENSIPALQRATEMAEKAYLEGNYRYTEWYAVQQELLASQMELIEAYTNIHQFNIEVQRLTGAIISK